MKIDLGLMLTGMLAIGFFAQWLAWRVKLPAILFLLLAGILLGPVVHALDPDQLLGPLLMPIVSLSVALILFEGSLTLRFHELSGISHVVRGLVSYGAIIALLMLAAAAHYFAGLGWDIALLFGALTCVTGPTVIVPMLRTLRPNERIANALRWEGIVIDPLGALFAVLIYEAIVSHHEGHAIGVFLHTVVIGVVYGGVAALVLAFLLRRQFIPEYLQNFGTLAIVLLSFTLSNEMAHDSGLLAVTIMGIALCNMRDVHIDDILDFKEHLTVLLVSMLFILLAARLSWPLPPGVLWAGIAIFLAAQFIVRPMTVIVSSFGSSLSWRERALISWVAPRGIVAASVTALFALRLSNLGVSGSEVLVPLVFILIIGTVVFQSATARPLARWLKVAEPEPHGVLIYGSDAVARAIGKALKEVGFHILLADDDWDGIRRGRMEGLNTFFGNPASAHADRNLDLVGIGQMLGLSTHRERNSLACLHYQQELGREKVYRLRNLAPQEVTHRKAFNERLLVPALFEDTMTHARFAELLIRGWRIKSTGLSATFDWPHFIEQYGSTSLLMFGVDEKGALRVAAERRELEPRPGWTVIVLVPPEESAVS
ncbi:cation:proton antiporter [Dyella caseinilytica]|uniref:Sodium:proton antiporter n=1 Tax=Dyella caseinilytica TaxID=1849581 RepID=A0ABX7GUP2_9GAMM|nr:sodium:proton antiporter [Dyella caseinilytica]QRN53472.1 sodium:proton antiporter [Dyella caseinilytica]GFZ86758.1 sodium/hydrogen antiporter [Dyella caseinilytica]